MNKVAGVFAAAYRAAQAMAEGPGIACVARIDGMDAGHREPPIATLHALHGPARI